MDFEDNFSTSSTDSESESLMATDNEGENEEQWDPWVPLIEEAKRRSDIALENVKEILINRGLEEQTASDQAYSNVCFAETSETTRKRLHATPYVDGTT